MVKSAEAPNHPPLTQDQVVKPLVVTSRNTPSQWLAAQLVATATAKNKVGRCRCFFGILGGGVFACTPESGAKRFVRRARGCVRSLRGRTRWGNFAQKPGVSCGLCQVRLLTRSASSRTPSRGSTVVCRTPRSASTISAASAPLSMTSRSVSTSSPTSMSS